MSLELVLVEVDDLLLEKGTGYIFKVLAIDYTIGYIEGVITVEGEEYNTSLGEMQLENYVLVGGTGSPITKSYNDVIKSLHERLCNLERMVAPTKWEVNGG